MDTPSQIPLDDSVRAVMGELPQPLQQFLASGKVEAVTKLLVEKYRLHLDQGTMLERALILMLLGVESPEEFSTGLEKDLGLSEGTVRALVADVNEQVFVPIRKQLEKEGAGTPDAPQPGTLPGQEQKTPMGVAEAAIMGTASAVADPPPTAHTPPRAEPPPPIPLRPKNAPPLVKEYAVDPYRESVE
ncbi:MAG: hypothetical protein B7X04_02665 [Parcubacteria group bacterium 21-54-25]|nr:MAG: hypothetical protein B7X04_02665 [Parcubacteria group bacterium 21-54-25]HQU07745.1 hypothetical protein [Candidatus Paceibacterota bacterium]